VNCSLLDFVSTDIPIAMKTTPDTRTDALSRALVLQENGWRERLALTIRWVMYA
jgi:hypothetical protein